jgi:hypothetical protein
MSEYQEKAKECKCCGKHVPLPTVLKEYSGTVVCPTTFSNIVEYQENRAAQIQALWEYSDQRPYKFLFLNGRVRVHRRHMLKRLSALLDQAVWTNLDLGNGPIKLLDSKYEFEKFNVT